MSNKIKVLVIDDDAAVRKMVCETLTCSGFEVRGAEDGEAGLISIEKYGQPDIVITDIIMPRREGFETIIEIRCKYPQIRVIGMSGGGRSHLGDFLKMARSLGADRVFSKPIDMEKLETAVEELAVGRQING